MAVAGCTSQSAGSPMPVPGETVESGKPPTTTGTELPHAGAPEVDGPLDPGRFEQDPCQALTPAQAGDLEVEWPGESREAPLGKACTWRGQNDRRALVEVAAQDKYPHGL